MSTRKPRAQVQNNPFIAKESQYQCAVRDCTNIGVWSPQAIPPPQSGAGTWYCRQHAELREPTPRWAPSHGPHTPEQIAEAKRKVKAFIESGKSLLEPPSDDWWHKLITRWRNGEKLLLIQEQMATQAWLNAREPPEWIPPDIEASIERAAIQSEPR
jgi:hypothetical protein